MKCRNIVCDLFTISFSARPHEKNGPKSNLFNPKKHFLFAKQHRKKINARASKSSYFLSPSIDNFVDIVAAVFAITAVVVVKVIFFSSSCCFRQSPDNI
jgi:hypothetical protein